LHAVPAQLLATLAIGLRGDSRIKMKLNNMKVTPDTMLLAAAVDRLSFLVWAKTKDGAAGRNRPKSIVEELTREKEEQTQTQGFMTPEDFDLEWVRLTGGGDGDGH
jgi:hypothetical protein